MAKVVPKRSPTRPQMLTSIEKLECTFPDLAARRVPSGITRYWGFVLGWPDWLWEDTPFNDEKELPKSLSLSDDLRLLANLCDHCGYVELLRLLLQMPRAPGEKQDVHAPNMKLALETKIRLIGLRNPQIDLHLKPNTRHALIEIEIGEAIGPFSTLYELSLLVILYRLARTFTGFVADQAALISQVELHITVSDQRLISDLGDLLQCQLYDGRTRATLRVPKTVLCLKSPEYDPFAWELVQAEIAKLEHKSASAQSFSRDHLIQIIQADLREKSKAPTLVQLANRLGMSERSLSRILTNQGTSLKSIKTKARMDLALELLQDPALALDQISGKLAYTETSSFLRAFKKHFGETPGKWRLR